MPQDLSTIYAFLVTNTGLLGLIAYLIKSHIGTYLSEKGRNLATKEDISEITNKIESVKSLHAGKIEEHKTALASKSHFSKTRYEREAKIYEELWPKLFELKESTLGLRPAFDYRDTSKTEEQIKGERGSKYFDSCRSLHTLVESRRPFYPEEIWKEIDALINITWREAIDYKHRDMGEDFLAYWDNAEKNKKEIGERYLAVCEAIRTRLAKFDEA